MWIQKLIKFKAEDGEDKCIYGLQNVNVTKIRDQKLKIKRINEYIPKSGIQKWRTSIHEFPLSSDIINDLSECLSLDLPVTFTDVLSLLTMQERFHLIHVITVLEERQKFTGQ